MAPLCAVTVYIDSGTLLFLVADTGPHTFRKFTSTQLDICSHTCCLHHRPNLQNQPALEKDRYKVGARGVMR